ncbi:MAG: response regulator [Deltaproteobacteria bacterium]|nr:response regulator [Deltaproteobacteria bacterium]
MGSILVVQSDPDTRDSLGRALRSAGHEVITAFVVREALLRLREGGIDAVLIDAYDPRVGVPELARQMESLPDTPPLVLISGSPHAPEISARVGAAAFIPKPYEASEITTAIDRVANATRPVKLIDEDELGDEDEEPTSPARFSS